MDCEIQELAHTADVGMFVRAATPALVFACAARGLFDCMGVRSGAPRVRETVTIESVDAESLLVDWLTELLYLFETTGRVYDQAEVTGWSPTRLTAVVEGGAPDQTPRRSVKAVTYHGLRFIEQPDAWFAEIYFDI